MRKFGWLGFALLLLCFVACKQEDNRVPCNNTTPTWDAKISAIVSQNCGASSCHGAASPSGDFTSYALMKPVLLDGRFEQQVLDSRVMPQNGVLPDSILATFQCWVANGFPER